MYPKFLLIFVVLIFDTYVISAQPSNGIPSEPGKCYAKCLLQEKVATEETLLPRHTGSLVDAQEDSNIYALNVTPKAATTEWVKKRADRNCRSANPDDCLVWCLVEVPAINEIEYFVKDTLLTTEYRWQYFSIEKIVRKGGYLDWVEVLCDANITVKLIKKLQKKLSKKGYWEGTNDGIHSEDLKNAIIAYQEQEGLDIGALTIETLKSLNVIR
jgi:hypothetical protein